MEGNQKKLHPLEHGMYNDTCCIGLIGGVCVCWRRKCGIFTVIFVVEFIEKIMKIRRSLAAQSVWLVGIPFVGCTVRLSRMSR